MENEYSPLATLIDRTIELIRGLGRRVFVAVLVLTALYVLSDQKPDLERLFLLASSGASLFFQYRITLEGLGRSNLLSPHESPPGVLVMFGLCILTGLGIALGLILLVVPGLFLAGRWFISVPILLAEDVRVFEAMRRSWERTSGRSGRMMLIVLLAYAPMILASLGAGVAEELGRNVIASVVLNLLLSISQVAAWCAAVAVYADGKREHELREVFA